MIDRWPDRNLPLLDRELEEMKRRHVPIVPIVCELNSRTRCTRAMEKMAPSLEFLPDPMVIEAEWRANQALAQKLEEDRAQQSARAPSTTSFCARRALLSCWRDSLERKKCRMFMQRVPVLSSARSS